MSERALRIVLVGIVVALALAAIFLAFAYGGGSAAGP